MVKNKYFKRQIVAGIILFISVIAIFLVSDQKTDFVKEWQVFATYDLEAADFTPDQKSLDLLEKIEVKGRAPKTGYSREKFSNNWGKINNCDLRNLILKRDLKNVKLARNNCKVLSGELFSQYLGQNVSFKRGKGTSGAVQIDHIVAVSDAWQKGAQNLTYQMRNQFYNDPENLIAVDGPQNQQKSDSDAASWLPKNKQFRCQYVARQVKIKYKYNLWVTKSEKEAITRELKKCY